MLKEAETAVNVSKLVLEWMHEWMNANLSSDRFSYLLECPIINIDLDIVFADSFNY